MALGQPGHLFQGTKFFVSSGMDLLISASVLGCYRKGLSEQRAEVGELVQMPEVMAWQAEDVAGPCPGR